MIWECNSPTKWFASKFMELIYYCTVGGFFIIAHKKLLEVANSLKYFINVDIYLLSKMPWDFVKLLNQWIKIIIFMA